MLPRWRQAFPKASAARSNDPQRHSDQPILIWLRLRMDFPVVEQVTALRSHFGEAVFIVLSDMPNDEEAIAVFSATARGYCNSHAAPEILRQVAHVVSQGGIWIGETLMQRLLSVADRIPAPPRTEENNWAERLTPKEREVAQLIATGANNKEIALKLGITERTVKAHMGTILNKLQVRDRFQLALLMSGWHRD
jgi:two-component system nitrate/nitrite response regulator NarL